MECQQWRVAPPVTPCRKFSFLHCVCLLYIIWEGAKRPREAFSIPPLSWRQSHLVPLYISNGCRHASRLAVTSVYLTVERNANLSSRLNRQDKQPLVLQLAPRPWFHPFSLLLPFSFGCSQAQPPSLLTAPTSNWPMGNDGVPKGLSTETLNLTLVIASNSLFGTAWNCTLCSASSKTPEETFKKKIIKQKTLKQNHFSQSKYLKHSAREQQRWSRLASWLASLVNYAKWSNQPHSSGIVVGLSI